MSRHGFTDDGDYDEGAELAFGRWRAQVSSALRGKRGQQFLRDLVAGLDALPEKRLITNSLETAGGEVCALGAVRRFRNIELPKVGPEIEDDDWEDSDWATLGNAFDIAEQLAREVMYENDEVYVANPEERWRKMRAWAVKRIVLREDELCAATSAEAVDCD